MPVTRSLCGLLLWLNASVALALDILLTNDDGFETANVRALYQRLKAAGHDVVISAPVHNHSGGGGRVEYQRAIGPLKGPSRFGGVQEGASGVGTDPQDKDVYYVDGTPGHRDAARHRRGRGEALGRPARPGDTSPARSMT